MCRELFVKENNAEKGEGTRSETKKKGAAVMMGLRFGFTIL